MQTTNSRHICEIKYYGIRLFGTALEFESFGQARKYCVALRKIYSAITINECDERKAFLAFDEELATS